MHIENGVLYVEATFVFNSKCELIFVSRVT